jgi:hypothetical protein
MNIRVCPQCGEAEHLEDYGRYGALFIHSQTGLITCSLQKKESLDEPTSDNNPDAKGKIHGSGD